MAVRGAHFLRYCVIGVANTAVCFSVIFLLTDFFDVDYVIGNGAGYGTGLAVSFILNKYGNFRSRGNLGRELVLFLASFAAAYALNLAVLIAAVRLVGLNGTLSQVVSGACYTIAFYFLMKGIAFKETMPSDS
jgi:putative flippase GtrA